MNKIFALTITMAFAGSIHAQAAAHPKAAPGIINKVPAAALNAQSNASAAGVAGNAAKPARNGATKCTQADAAKNGTAGTPCHPASSRQM